MHLGVSDAAELAKKPLIVQFKFFLAQLDVAFVRFIVPIPVSACIRRGVCLGACMRACARACVVPPLDRAVVRGRSNVHVRAREWVCARACAWAWACVHVRV